MPKPHRPAFDHGISACSPGLGPVATNGKSCRRHGYTATSLVLTLLTLAILPACTQKQAFPEPTLGWHNADYSIVFGRLQQLPSTNPDLPPVWTIRYGAAGERYSGEFALTPASRLIGYIGGEQVEVHGKPRPDLAYPTYPGSWYELTGIRLWSPRR